MTDIPPAATPAPAAPAFTGKRAANGVRWTLAAVVGRPALRLEAEARHGVGHALQGALAGRPLDAVGEGGGLVLVAPHDPLPLLRQLEERHPGTFTVDYLQRGPEAWRLQLVRTGA